MRSRIGECLVDAGLITQRQLARAVKEQAQSGERLGVVLARLKLASEAQIATALASQLGLPYVDFDAEPLAPDVAALIPREVALGEACLAMRREKDTLTVAMADPLRLSLVQELQDRTGYRIREVVATRSAILAAIDRVYPDVAAGQATPAETDSPSQPSDEAPVPADEVVDRILRQAIVNDASDVQIDPTGSDVVVRFRIDGVLREWLRLPSASHDDVVARFKILAGMDVAEKLLPQSGRVRLPGGDDGSVDMRAFTLRTHLGERVVLTARSHRRRAPALEELGMTSRVLDELRAALAARQGLIVVAGPAGSGRSRTLAAALASVAAGRSAVAIEDSIEYEIPGVAHAQVAGVVGLTFANALRAVLQQRPDVILLSDLPDPETALLLADAVQAGVLALASVTATDAYAALLRLRELGIDPASPSTLQLVIGQRLVRRLCEQCRVPHEVNDDQRRTLGLSGVERVSFFEPAGCGHCDYTGYRGRVGLFETIRMSDVLRRSFGDDPSGDRAREIAQAGGSTLAEDAVAKARSGLTSLDEARGAIGQGRDTRPLCSSCGAVVSVEFAACPRCGERLRAECPHCGRALDPGWAYCPFCARKAAPPAPSARRGIMRLVRNPDRPDLV